MRRYSFSASRTIHSRIRCAQAKKYRELEFGNEIKILKELINNTKENSELLIIGFHNEFLSEKSFRKLFDKRTVPNRRDFAYFKIELNENHVDILNNILAEEGEEFISDITHFAIKSVSGFSAISYDGLSSLYINTDLFSSDLKPLKECKENKIVIEFQQNLNDNGIFNWNK